MIVAGGKNRRVQVRAPSKNSWTKARRGRFLVALAETCNVLQASAAAGVAPRSAYYKRAKDESFAAAWAEAMAAGYDRLEGELLARALGGPDAERVAALAEEGADAVMDAPCAFDADLALKLLAQRNATLRAGPERRGPRAAGHVPVAVLEMSLLRKLDAIGRRLARDAAAAARLIETQRARRVRDAVAQDLAVRVRG